MSTAKKLAPVTWFVPTLAETRWYAAYAHLFGEPPEYRGPNFQQAATRLVAHDERVDHSAELRQESVRLREQANEIQKSVHDLCCQAAALEAQGTNWLKRRRAAALRKQALPLVEQADSLRGQANDLLSQSVALEKEVYSLSARSAFTHNTTADIRALGLASVNWYCLAQDRSVLSGEEERRARQLLDTGRMHLYSSRRERVTDSRCESAAQSWWLLWAPETNPSVTGEEMLVSIQATIKQAQVEPAQLQYNDLFGWSGGVRRDWSFTLWVFQGFIYEVKAESEGLHSDEELALLVFEAFDRERRRFERIKSKYAGSTEGARRPRIPESVRVEVWRRDGGKCARCGSRENLEYDHIVPLSKGGSNTARNIELLCEQCNRSKGADIA